jgi:hypothetical protein
VKFAVDGVRPKFIHARNVVDMPSAAAVHSPPTALLMLLAAAVVVGSFPRRFGA